MGTRIWPNYCGNEYHTAYNPQLEGPVKSLVKYTFRTGGAIVSSPAVDTKGNIYFGSTDFFFYKLSPSGELLWKYDATNQINSSPALNTNENVVYFGESGGILYAMDTTTGSVLWTFQTGASLTSSPYYYENNGQPIIFIGGEDWAIYAVNAVTGAQLWIGFAGQAISYSSPVVFNQVLYIASDDTTVRAHNALTGQFLWLYNTTGAIR